MKLNWKVRCLAVGVVLSSAMAFAEQINESPVLTVLGKAYTASELGLTSTAAECRELEPLTKGVIGPLFADYIEKAEISVSEEDLRDFCRRQLSEGELFTEVWPEWAPQGMRWRARQKALIQLMGWKLQLSLFNRYGGRVIHNEWAQPQAFDAMFAYVVERETDGDFSIHDAQLKLRFWECLRQPSALLLSEEEGRPILEAHPAE